MAFVGMQIENGCENGENHRHNQVGDLSWGRQKLGVGHPWLPTPNY